jgi:hypothetical protein
MGKGIVRPAVPELLSLGINTDEPSRSEWTGWVRDIRPAVFIQKEVPDANASGPVAEHALGLRHNHPQLYLNLAEVYQTAGRPQEAIGVLEKGLASIGSRPQDSARLRQAWQETETGVVLFAPQQRDESNPGKVAPPFDGAASGSLGRCFIHLVRSPHFVGVLAGGAHFCFRI